MTENTKTRQRVKAEPDKKLLTMLKSGDQKGLELLLSNPTLGGLAAIEETIALYTDNSDVTFYRLGGQRVFTQNAAVSAAEEILLLAMADRLLYEPVKTQSLIAALGMAPKINQEIMQTLSMIPQRMYDYQLLGVQMQLAYLLDK